MNILVFGAGAVGITFGTALVVAGDAVTMLARGAIADELRSQGMGFGGVVGSHHIDPHKFKVADGLAAALTESYDMILCCTKVANLTSWQDDILTLARANPKAMLVFMQNGWGINAHFAHEIAPERMANAGVQLGITRASLTRVHINSAGDPSDIGRIGFTSNHVVLDQLISHINVGGISCQFAPDIGSALWKKMLYNCTTNAPSALLNVANGGLGGTDGRALMGLIVGEIYGVIHALGYHPPVASPGAFADLMINEMIPLTADHISSMLQDRRQGRPTEIEFLNGAVVKVAESFGLPCFANKTIYHLVRMMQGNV